MTLNVFNKWKLKKSLIKHEGYEIYPYLDKVGKITIGIGYNLADRGMSKEWIMKQFEEDASYLYNAINDAFPFFKDLNDDRKIVLVDMAFMGLTNLFEFKKMFSAIEDGNFELAAKEMLNSKWAKQVKGRAIELSKAMETGDYNP